MNNCDQIVEFERLDEGDGKPLLLLLGYRYGIVNEPSNVELRNGSYVSLTARGQRKLMSVNKVRS